MVIQIHFKEHEDALRVDIFTDRPKEVQVEESRKNRISTGRNHVFKNAYLVF